MREQRGQIQTACGRWCCQTYILGARKRKEKNCGSGNRTLDLLAERLASWRLRYQDVSQNYILEVFQLNLSQSIRFISLSSPKYVSLATPPPTGCLNLPALLSHWLTSMAHNSKRVILSLHFFVNICSVQRTPSTPIRWSVNFEPPMMAQVMKWCRWNKHILWWQVFPESMRGIQL